MRLADFLIEPIVTAMLAAGATGPASEQIPDLFPGRLGASAVEPRPAQGAEQLSASELEVRLRALLDSAKSRAAAAGYPQDYSEAADFAVCALIDELLLGSSWAGRDEWLRHSLQRTRHGTSTAGEDFYRLLDDLLDRADRLPPLQNVNALGEKSGAMQPAPGETPLYPQTQGVEQGALCAALEIFALCLSQGFTGMYFHDPVAVRTRLLKILAFLPDLRAWSERNADMPLFSPASAAGPGRGGARALSLRFDLLDILLWIVPPTVLVLLYHFYASRLDGLLETLFSGK